MAIQPSPESIGTRDTWPDLLDKRFDVMWLRRDEAADLVLGQFFDKQMLTGGDNWKMGSVGRTLPLPLENEDTEATPYHAPAPGFDKTATVVLYQSGVRVTRSAIEVDRFGRIAGMLGGLITSSQRKDEYMRAAILNNAFTGDDGADSKDLCDDAHPHERAEASGTWDNKTTGALAGPSLQAARLLARKMVGEDGDPDPLMPLTLLIPEDLEQKAHELIDSRAKPDGMLNNVNWGLNFDIVVSPYLSSAVQFYLFGDRTGDQKGLIKVELFGWNIGNNSPSDRRIVIDKSITACRTVGFTKSKNVLGSTGA